MGNICITPHPEDLLVLIKIQLRVLDRVPESTRNAIKRGKVKTSTAEFAVFEHVQRTVAKHLEHLASLQGFRVHAFPWGYQVERNRS